MVIFLLTHLTPLSTTCKTHLKKTVKVYCLRSLRPTPSPVFSTQRPVLGAVPATVSVWFHTANDCALFTVPPLFFAGSHYYYPQRKHTADTPCHTHTDRSLTEFFIWPNMPGLFNSVTVSLNERTWRIWLSAFLTQRPWQTSHLWASADMKMTVQK